MNIQCAVQVVVPIFFAAEYPKLTPARALVLHELIRSRHITKVILTDYTHFGKEIVKVEFDYSRSGMHAGPGYIIERKDLWDPTVWVDLGEDPKLFLGEVIEDLISRPDKIIYEKQDVST